MIRSINTIKSNKRCLDYPHILSINEVEKKNPKYHFCVENGNNLQNEVPEVLSQIKGHKSHAARPMPNLFQKIREKDDLYSKFQTQRHHKATGKYHVEKMGG